MKRNQILRWLMVPLGLALGLGAGWWLFQPGTAEVDRFAQYFSPHPIRDLDTGPMPHWAEAVQAYSLGDYVAANTALRQAEQAEELPAVVTRFYQGQCLLATGFSQEAVTVYKQLLQQPAGPHDSMRWYLALAYLDLHELAAARETLQEIISIGGYYAGTAAQLLDELDSGAP